MPNSKEITVRTRICDCHRIAFTRLDRRENDTFSAYPKLFLDTIKHDIESRIDESICWACLQGI